MWGVETTAEPVTGRLTAVLVLSVGLIALSSGAVLTRSIEAPTAVAAFYRVAVAWLFVGPLFILQVRLGREVVQTKSQLYKGALAGVFLALHFALWMGSLNYTSIANSVILADTAPIFVLLWNWITGRTRPSRGLLLSVFLTFIGAIVVCWDSITVSSGSGYGNIQALLSGVALTAYLLTGGGLRREISALSYMVVCYGSAAIVIGLFCIGSRQPMLGYDAKNISLFIALGLFSQVLGHGSYNWALRYLSAQFISIFLLGELFVSPLMGYIILKEPIATGAIIGGAFILVGLVIALRLPAAPPQRRAHLRASL